MLFKGTQLFKQNESHFQFLLGNGVAMKDYRVYASNGS